MVDARTEQRTAGALDEAAVIDRLELKLRRLEQVRETLVVILVGMRHHGCRNRDYPVRVETQVEAPAEKAEHVVRLAGVDQHEAVVGCDDERAVALADVHEIHLEEPLLLEVRLLHPPGRTSRSYLRPLAIVFSQQRDEVSPDQLLRFRPSGHVENERCGIAGKCGRHGRGSSQAAILVPHVIQHNRGRPSGPRRQASGPRPQAPGSRLQGSGLVGIRPTLGPSRPRR